MKAPRAARNCAPSPATSLVFAVLSENAVEFRGILRFFALVIEVIVGVSESSAMLKTSHVAGATHLCYYCAVTERINMGYVDVTLFCILCNG